ncbi:MAG: DNA polymerase III subunit delta' [Dehalococcoidales bacterium]|nr:MAG: DNA polymerase III subunit delta' [Dehalococcoidales bacterium]
MVWDVVGQTRAISLLQRSLEAGSLSHAYLLVGPAHVGKMTLALDLAKAVNCESAESPCGECAACQRIAEGKHSDIQVIDLGSGDGNSTESEARVKISVEQIEQMQHSAFLPPFEGRCKVFVLDGAEFFSLGAANRLLKTLEEPVGGVVFILLTVNEKLLPTTIVSRCQRIELAPLGTAEVEAALTSRWGVESDKARLLSRLANGCLGWAVSAARDGQLLQHRAEVLDKLLEITDAGYEQRFQYVAELAGRFSQNRRAVLGILQLWLDWWRDLLLVKLGCSDAITNVDRSTQLDRTTKSYTLTQIRVFIENIRAAGDQLQLNANPQLALEVLMLGVPEKNITKGPVPGVR